MDERRRRDRGEEVAGSMRIRGRGSAEYITYYIIAYYVIQCNRCIILYALGGNVADEDAEGVRRDRNVPRGGAVVLHGGIFGGRWGDRYDQDRPLV
jgi:hypothetical protein